MKTKRLAFHCLILALLSVAILASGCKKDAAQSNRVDSPTASGSGPSSNDEASLLADYKRFYEAAKRGDIEAYKSGISSGALREVEQRASQQNLSLDEGLETFMRVTPPSFPEIRDVKIQGDRATLELKGQDGSWQKAYFLKEEGVWKVTSEF